MNKIKKVGGRSQRASDSGSGDLGCVGGNLAAARITSWPTEENPPHIRITLHCFLRIGAEYYLNCDCAVQSWHLNRVLTHPDSGLGEVGPHADLLPGAHVGVAVPREQRLQLLQLLRGEVCPLAPLPLLLAVLVQAVVVAVAHLAALAWRLARIWNKITQWKVSSCFYPAMRDYNNVHVVRYWGLIPLFHWYKYDRSYLGCVIQCHPCHLFPIVSRCCHVTRDWGVMCDVAWHHEYQYQGAWPGNASQPPTQKPEIENKICHR